MKSRYITWEIIVAGLALTILAFYVLNTDKNDHYSDNFAFTNESHKTEGAEIRETPPAPEPPPAELQLHDLEKLENLQQLKELESIKDFDELKQKFREFSALFDKQKLEQALQNLEQDLEKLESHEVQVQLDNGQKVTIRKKYKTPERQWTAVESDVYVYRENLNPDHLRQLKFALNAGQFSVIGGHSENPYLSLRAKGDIKSSEVLTENVDVQSSSQENHTEITITNRYKSGFFNRVDMEAILYLPSDTRVEASTKGGHVTAQALTNRSDLSTSGGHITLEDMKGDIKAHTKGGHITVDKSGGNLSAKTYGGHIKLHGFNGDVEAKTSGGHLYLEDIRGSLQGSTSGGNIQASIIEPRGNIQLSTSAGNIKIELPLNEEVRVKFSGMHTSIDSDFNFSGEQRNDYIEGTLLPPNSKTPPGDLPLIEANCSFGNVSLSPYEQ